MANAKTLRKRIALVAAAALGVGMLAAAPASAATTPVFTGGTVVLGTGATTTGHVTAVTATFGSVTRASATTWTSTLSLALTGTGFDANTTYTVAGTTAATTGTAPSAFVGTTGLTFGTATSQTISGTVTFTASTDNTYANVLAAADTYAMTITVKDAGADVPVAASAVNVTIPSPGSASFLAGTAYSGSGSALTQVVGGIATLSITNGASDTTYTITSSGVGNLASHLETGTTVSAATYLNGSNLSGGLSWTPVRVGNMALGVSSTVAGTTTVTLQPLNASGVPGTAVTATVTWIAAPAYSAANSSTSLALGNGVNANAADATVALAKTAGVATAQANILVTIKDQNAAAFGGQTVSATVTGPGLISVQTGNTGTVPVGSARYVSLTLGSTVSTAQIGINADGTAGTASIAVSVNGVVLATKTVTFTGTAATYAVTQGFSAFRVGTNGADGNSTNYGVAVKVTDSNGNTVADGTTVYATSGTTANATISASQTTTSGYAYFNVQGVAEGTSVLTFANASTSPTVTATTTVNVTSSVAATVTLAFDKATYNPGDKIVLTLTAKDAAGQPISDVAAATASYTNFLAADLTASTSLGGASLGGSATPTFVNGVKTWTLYAPLTAGPFSVNGTTGTATGLATAAQSKALSAAATVTTTPDATIAAAKAAADAATAAVATLSTTVAALVASITAQIKALSALVKKIMTKLKIK